MKKIALIHQKLHLLVKSTVTNVTKPLTQIQGLNTDRQCHALFVTNQMKN